VTTTSWGSSFGYQDRTHFYLFDWKQNAQNDPLGGFADRGMSVKVVSADSELRENDLWPTAGNGTRVRTLYHNNLTWAHFQPYDFTLDFTPGTLHHHGQAGNDGPGHDRDRRLDVHRGPLRVLQRLARWR
jgi:hypothetical protein